VNERQLGVDFRGVCRTEGQLLVLRDPAASDRSCTNDEENTAAMHEGIPTLDTGMMNSDGGEEINATIVTEQKELS